MATQTVQPVWLRLRLISCLFAILVVLFAWFLPPILVVAGIVALLLLATVMRFPIAGFCLLAFSIPWGSGFSVAIGSFPVTSTDALIALISGVWIASAVSRRQNPIRSTAWTPFVVLFIAAIGVSVSQAADWHASLREIVKWLEMLAIYLAGLWFMRSRRDLALVLVALISAAVSQAGFGYAQFAFSLGPAAFIHHQFLRAFGSFDQPNPYAGYLNMIFPLCAALAALPLPRWARIWSGIAGLLIFGALIASESRGALLGTALALAVIVVVRWPGTRQAFGIAILASLIFALVANFGLVSLGPLEKVLDAVGVGGVSFDHVTDANFSAVERAAHWLAGVRMFAAHPILGVGIGNYAAAYPAYHPRSWYAPLAHAHNYYINVAAEAGVLGLATYLLLVGSALWYSYASLRRCKDPLLFAAILGVVGALLATDFHNLFDVLYVHGLVALLGLLMSMVPVSLKMTTALEASPIMRPIALHAGTGS